MTDIAPDLKPRSRDVTDGLERAAARGMLRAVGMGDDDWEKPQIGVASSWNEITPCNLSLDRLAKAVKDGVHAASRKIGAFVPLVPRRDQDHVGETHFRGRRYVGRSGRAPGVRHHKGAQLAILDERDR